MSVTTFGPGALSREKAERLWPGMQYGDSLVFWGLISFRDSHSRDEEVKRFIADRMSIWAQEYVAGEAEHLDWLLRGGGVIMSPCDFWDDIGFEVPRSPYAMLWDADVNDRTERQFVASGMAQAGRLALLSEDTGAVISIPWRDVPRL